MSSNVVQGTLMMPLLHAAAASGDNCGTIEAAPAGRREILGNSAKRSVLNWVSGLVFSVAAACSGYDDAITPLPAGAHTVDAVGETAWTPSQITIAAGEEVTFRNGTRTLHNVQFDGDVPGRPANVGDFDSALRSVRFTTAGTFAYHCGNHPVMQGRVVVGS